MRDTVTENCLQGCVTENFLCSWTTFCVRGRLYMGSLEPLLEKMPDVLLLQHATISSVFHSVYRAEPQSRGLPRGNL